MVVPLPLFFFLCSISLPLSVTVAQQVNYRAHICTYQSSYDPKAALAFQANLNLTLLYLNSNSTTSGGFYNTSSGSGSDTTYGSFLCRGDISPELCQACIRETSKDIISRCPNHKEAYIWYDECMLRFSNRSIFSRLQRSPGFCLWNLYDVSYPSEFNKTVNKLMNRLVSRAVSSKKLYATEDVNTTVFDRLYGLVQCTPDITPSQCNECLSRCVQHIPGCCSGKRGGRLLTPSCSIRFESEPFYNQPLSPAPAPLPPHTPPTSLQFYDSEGNSLRKILAISIPIAAILVILLSTLCWFCWDPRRKNDVANQENGEAGDQISTVESTQFELSTIQVATNNFSDANKIGEGGYGPVYQGTLPDGQKIAVKRLSQSSDQGEQEFKNEVEVVVKLQHRNLVRLLGFCLHGEEKILIYEYVPNKSLNYFLFDPQKQMRVDWPMRIKIIDGVARGLLYLHEDSRLRIIHRDLKPSNVLLDENMNPKISDFGMARIFVVDQSQENTKIIAGTFGYMPPEYELHGQYSVKSDVFSFGVLVLEIISGKKNTTSSFFHSDNSEGLLSYAWRKWKEGSAIEVAQAGLSTSCPEHEVTRCIHVALLCAQEDPTERPTMETVVLMLSSLSVNLPLPKRPAFFPYIGTEPNPTTASESNQSVSVSASSVNEASFTEPYPR